MLFSEVILNQFFVAGYHACLQRFYCSMLPVFGVRVSATFHLMCVHIIFSSVWVAEWPPFGKELLTRLTICSLCILTIYNSIISRFGFEGGIWILIAHVPGLCILITFTEENLLFETVQSRPSFSFEYITKTSPYNEDSLAPHLYIVNWGLHGYTFVIIFAQKDSLWVLVRTASLRRF